MKTREIYGEGVCGLNVELTIGDMCMANQMANNLKEVIDSRAAIEAYNKIPYDKRKDENGNAIERPTEIIMSTENLKKLHCLMCKFSASLDSSIFDDIELPF